MLTELIESVASAEASRTALVWRQGEISYGELLDQVHRVADRLVALDVGRGDVVALVLGNSPAFAVTFFAATSVGAIVLPLNHRLRDDELTTYLREVGAAVIVASDDRAPMLRDVGRTVAPAGLLQAGAAFAGAQPDSLAGATHADALFQYSSGSTGPSKRAVRTMAALRTEADNFVTTTQLRPDDAILCSVPLSHAHGLGNGMLAAARAGCRLVLVDGLQRTTALELIESQRVTVFPATPFVFRALADTSRVRHYDLSSLRLCLSAGAPLPRDTYDDFLNLTGLHIRQLYGCTEAGSVTVNLSDDPSRNAHSVGQPMVNVRVEIVDHDGRPCPRGVDGNVAVHSGALFRGYASGGEPDRSAFCGDAFVTGDVGHFDEAGDLVLTGRRTKFISTAGHKVDPQEVERAIRSLPAVDDVVVVGLPGMDGSETIKAVVVASGIVTRSQVIEACRGRLSPHKVPRMVEFRDELPKDAMGKVLKKYLVKPA